jgi:alanyl-tRNA synthetase
MTSLEIRQSFLDFFKSKGHTIVPSASLMPNSPNLLFTNAGMNQFVPIFLAQRSPDVSTWAGAIPGSDTRAADTQKCIRAGGKHNDLEDVGLDTYHHTFFEMLGNWSFGDYFKKEAITWAWELITDVWKFPSNRLYATVYSPDKSKGDPSEYDQEAADIWAGLFRGAGLDPKVHIVPGNKKDNFWMMGDTGPCGPCSEIHVDLTPQGDTRGRLVNQGSAECIEIWNLVFIQFNANPDGTFSPLPAKHVDTGMGFERLTSFIQCTRGFTDFSRPVSNYETDIFRPLFDQLEKLSGKRYGSTLPNGNLSALTVQQNTDIAFRVLADHIRTLSFAIADGILPGNTDRNYVLRRILRRAVRYGRSLGFHEPFFYKLVDVLAETMGHVFPEIRAKCEHVEEVIHREEEAFNKTLDRGIELFREETEQLRSGKLRGDFAFKLYDTYGFPLDLTELMARERGLSVDVAGFTQLMEEQKARARAAQKKQVIELSQIDTEANTAFIGYEKLEAEAKVLEVVSIKGKSAVVVDRSPFYAEMGGQVGDTGELSSGGKLWRIANTQKAGNAWLHFIEAPNAADAAAERDLPDAEAIAVLSVDQARRRAIQRHHTVTHLLHWALHQVVSADAIQKGSYVGPDKLTFDFSSGALTAQQVADIERLVNELIVENAAVSWLEVKYSQVKNRGEIMQFFGDKYGDLVRVVQVGGRPAALDGYSMELCGGTHVTATGEIGLFRISAESAIAAGIRRIEATAGLEAYNSAVEQQQFIRNLGARLNCPFAELEKRVESLLAQQKELEKRLKSFQQEKAAGVARDLRAKAETLGSAQAVVQNLGTGDGDHLQSIADFLKGQFSGVIVLGSSANGAVALVAAVPPELTSKIQAGKIIQAIAPLVGGKGGGRPDNARGGGKEVAKLDEALARARELIKSACAV